MALNVKIDFNNCYEIDTLSNDLTISRFETELIDCRKISLGVVISNEAHPFLPDVYNLAFGPLEDGSRINDRARITHKDHSKVFSTIVFIAMTFLKDGKRKYLGIDGASNARAYLYYRIIQNNYSILMQYFDIYGVNYYVRVLRMKNDHDDGYPVDPDDIRAVPNIIKSEDKISVEKLYNYFILKLKG